MHLRSPKLRSSTAVAALTLAGCMAEVADSDEGAFEGAELAGLTACPASNVIADPPLFAWKSPADETKPCNESTDAYCVGTMEAGAATFTINGQTLTTRAYRQAGGNYSIPGPTLKMKPGRKYVMRLHNTLPYEALNTSTNVQKDPNVVNLHTHGLHVSGESPGDDVTRSFEGQRGGDFVYDIPADHMGGTFWYHAHHHGSTELQVAGGMFGGLIIDDSNDNLPANVAAMTERQLLIAYLDPSVAGTGGDTLMAGTLTATWTANGLVNGALCMPQNEWQHFRILVAHPVPTERTLAVGSNCEVQMLARDGVWRTTAPKSLSTRSLSIPGASRVDLAIRCSNDSNITIAGTTVANLYVNGAGNTTVGPFSNGSSGGTWPARRPTYLRDLRTETNLNNVSIQMGARTINGVKFNHDVPNMTLDANKVQHWSLSGAQQHPFHLHVYHQQAQNCSGDFENGEYYDVVSQGCAVRFDLNATTARVYEGRTIMHCHILEHEDQGAMGWADVVGGVAPPTFPSASFSEYYTLGGTTPVCGDATCNGTETQCSCPGDCGAAPATETSCTDGISNDCDGTIDCADSDCVGNAACVSVCDADGTCEGDEDCTNCSSDCASVTGGQPSKRYCCGDGVQQSAETTAICDGNF